MTNRIHPTAILGPQVELGSNNVIGPYCVLQGAVVLGDDNFVAAHVSIGGGPEVRGHELSASWEDHDDRFGVTIGSRNVFKEFVAVNAGWVSESSVGDDGYFMGHVHLNHDACVGNEVTMSGHAVAAGHVTIDDGANIGLGAVIHQRRTVPAGAMIGMQAAVTTDLPPFVVSMGVPARPTRLNSFRLDKLAVTAVEQEALKAILLGDSTDTSALTTAVRAPVDAWLDRSHR